MLHFLSYMQLRYDVTLIFVSNILFFRCLKLIYGVYFYLFILYTWSFYKWTLANYPDQYWFIYSGKLSSIFYN